MRSIQISSNSVIRSKICITVLLLFLSTVVLLTFMSINAKWQSANASACESVNNIIASLTRRVEDGSSVLTTLLSQLDGSAAYKQGGANDNGLVPDLIHSGRSHEILRRRALFFAREIWRLSSAYLDPEKRAQASNAHSTSERGTLQNLEELTRLLQLDLIGLGNVDGLGAQRVAELDRLTGIVRQRIKQLQNPVDCAQARFLVVNLDRPCGFGCNVHHLTYCFQIAYFSGRTLVLGSNGGTFTRMWAELFLPFSPKCPTAGMDHSGAPEFDGSPSQDAAPALLCPYIVTLAGHAALPPAVPSDLASDLSRAHGAPFPWFIGQLTAYAMRPGPMLEELLNSTMVKYNLAPVSGHRSPVVGVHVRRTDKVGTEASFHSLAEYMGHVERQFKFWDAQQSMMSRSHEWQGDSLSAKLSPGPIPRHVFIATDDSSVLREARSRFPGYVFHFDLASAESASVHKRSEDDSVRAIALDILVLARTDYLVCTFSSQVCRVAYELMQTRHSELGDASDLVQSLDDMYYFGGQQSNPYETIVADSASQMEPGDLVHLRGNLWNGYAVVQKPTDSNSVTAPAYKFRPRVLTAKVYPSIFP